MLPSTKAAKFVIVVSKRSRKAKKYQNERRETQAPRFHRENVSKRRVFTIVLNLDGAI